MRMVVILAKNFVTTGVFQRIRSIVIINFEERSRMRVFLMGIIFLMSLLTVPFSVSFAQEAPKSWPFASSPESIHVQAELVSEVTSIIPGETFWVALRLSMDPGWHTYWKNPGDFGLATKIDWSLPPGFSAGPIVWPQPESLKAFNFTVYAYEDEVLLLTEIEAPYDAVLGDSYEIAGQADWLACEVDCIPGRADVVLKLPVSNEVPEMNPEWAEAFAETRTQLPVPGLDWRISAMGFRRDLKVQIISREGMEHDFSYLEFLPEDTEIVDHSAKQIMKKTDTGYELIIPRSAIRQGYLETIEGILLSDQGWEGKGTNRAMAIDVPVLRVTWMDEIKLAFDKFLSAILSNKGGATS